MTKRLKSGKTYIQYEMADIKQTIEMQVRITNMDEIRAQLKEIKDISLLQAIKMKLIGTDMTIERVK